MSEFTKASYACISERSQRSGGFVSRRQLLSWGVPRGTIQSWLHTGRLLRFWPGVYAVGHMPQESRARAHGALLAGGERSALAGWSAGALYGCVSRWEPFELISPQQRRVSGLTIHRSGTLLSRDVSSMDGLRVTSPARTALDLAPRVGEKRLKRIVDNLRLHHGLTIRQLIDVIVRNRRHPGAELLRGLIRVLSKHPTRSELERRWSAIAERFDIGPCEQNAPVAGYEVDVLIDGLVIVELDTIETHLLNMESDRHRDADILAQTGIPTIRLLDTDLDGDMTPHAANIHATVARERARAGWPSE
jgi:hypothetical protein